MCLMGQHLSSLLTPRQGVGHNKYLQAQQPLLLLYLGEAL